MAECRQKKPVSLAEELQTVWILLLFSTTSSKPLYSPDLLLHKGFMCNAQFFFLSQVHTPLMSIHINKSVECVYVHVFINVPECRPSVCKKMSEWPILSLSAVIRVLVSGMIGHFISVQKISKVWWKNGYINRSCSRTSGLNNVNSDGGWWVWWCGAEENTIISVSSLTGVCDAKVHIKKNDIADREWARQREYQAVILSNSTHWPAQSPLMAWTCASMKNLRVIQWGKLRSYWKSVTYV